MWQEIRLARCTNKQESRQTYKETNKQTNKARRKTKGGVYEGQM